MRTLQWTTVFGVNLALVSYFSVALWSPASTVKRSLLPGKTTHGHYQIELDCNACHSPGMGVQQDACTGCHASELKEANDTHPASKFNDPTNAALLATLDAQKCITCHREHVEDQTLAMGLSLPGDYCYHCHQETLINRPSHSNLAFDSCATAGCHNFHDNRALYENFLIKHVGEPDLLDEAVNPARSYPEEGSIAKLTVDMADHPDEVDVTSEVIVEWSDTAHALAGVNCRGCHAIADESGDSESQAWSNSVSLDVCQRCHENQADSFLSGRHGMRLAAGLGPMTPGEARLPMNKDAAHRELTCHACHQPHSYDTQYAAIDACLACHNDRHSLEFKTSTHYTLWQQEMEGTSVTNSGVSCATCHMPRIEMGDKVIVDHNQNNTLRPNEKMIRTVCMNCHGLQFSLDALASQELIDNCFASTPTERVESLDMAQAWFDEKEKQRQRIQANRATKE